jgi:hypothetical protein
MKIDYEVAASIVYDLSDAKEDLTKIIELFDYKKDTFDEDEFRVRMAHLYWHLNCAWHKRNIDSKDLENADGKQMGLWGEFPKDIKPL